MNIKTKLSLFLLAAASQLALAQESYKIQPVAIQTRWAKTVSPENALKEYPRPQMVRENWTNLNGLWDYAITKKDEAKPEHFQGKILVPYPIESALSGVKKSLQPEENLWYERSINYKAKSGMRTRLNFGAVDYACWVYLNGKEIGHHEGGYTEFSFDITQHLKTGANTLSVKVFDPSDAGIGPRGKQVLHPQNIYYTPSSGIWQTVWLEELPEKHIEKLSITPDIDKGQVNVTVSASTESPVSLTVAGKTITGTTNQNITFPIPTPKYWSPTSPYLYDLTVKLGSDVVKSYFGMRKISIGKDEKGTERILLNNKPYYNLGTLDQGFWPEGLHTAPSDEALAFDIKAIKAMGFNTIRKHIKVEPARWYYHADKIGMLVWQDFVQPNPGLPPGAKEIFEKQGAEMLSQLHNYPSIVTWVLFNEKWGQYDQERLSQWVKQTDPSRILNGHSGEYLYVNGQLRSPSPNAYINADLTDVHAYPDPMNSIKMAGKAQVCGEFGGIGVFIPDHQWLTGTAWGYIQEKPAALKAKYAQMNAQLKAFQTQGLSGSIYTQPFDVEGEQNGLMSYDREVIKIPFTELREIHSALNPQMGSLPVVTAQDADLTDPAIQYQKAVATYLAGEKSTKTLSTIARGTVSTKDEGFSLMVKSQEEFRKAMGSSEYSKFMAAILFKEAIQPMFSQQKSWEEIGVNLKTNYGEVGEETYLKIKAIGAYNAKDWKAFKPVASEYLEKYGKYLSTEDKAFFQSGINQAH
ncbi:glycoside hydrolase family 2 protein [Pedobacter aquatilis]|uniref:glycoside hydrolase family 2 protein n=1 Tax=Pedobacter aquatilis TaxID=351343 RepID=UPI0029305A6E|nr:sugar-binding domain-containing protein [Pedobacter aquatilis]